MSKKERIDGEDFVEDPMASATAEEDAAKLEKYKEQKREAAQRHKEKVAAEKAKNLEDAKALKAKLEETGIWDQMDDNLKAFVDRLATPKASHHGGSSLMTQLFGPDPKVGDSVTLNDAFQRTFKGKSTLDFYVKRWATKGTVIEFKQDSANMLNSTYTIVSIN